MSICMSANCPKYSNCARAHCQDSKVQDCVDWASYGSGSSSGDLEYFCGPNGNYKMFIPIYPVYQEGQLYNPEADQKSDFYKLKIQCKEIILLKDELKLEIDLSNDNILRSLDYIEINGIKFKREDKNESKDKT